MSTPAKNTEVFKHQLALDLEARKWSYKQAELHYQEAGHHLRSLNQIMWQVPGMAIAITGGLWYGATTVDQEAPRIGVLVFAAFVDLLTIPIIWRLRSIIGTHIETQKDFFPTSHLPKGGRFTVIGCWTAMLVIAAALSVGGACYAELLSKKVSEDKDKPEATCRVEIQVSNPPPSAGLEIKKHTNLPKPPKKIERCP